MEIKGFTLVNENKVERALNGNPTSKGNVGGVGMGAYLEQGVWLRNGKELNEKEIDKLEDGLLAEYDKLGGLIKQGEDTVKTGSFYNFKAKKPQTDPIITLVFNINGRVVELKEGDEEPKIIKAARLAKEVKEELSAN